VWLLVGLGNPGLPYRDTRHNIGFCVIDHLAGTLSLSLNEKSLKARWTRGFWNTEKVVLAKPHTYMNASGEAVALLADHFNIDSARIVVVHDDMDLPLGRIKIREKGGDGGHKGVRSIIRCLESEQFVRVRMGIGRSAESGEEIDYVLDTFDEEQKPIINEQVEQACEAIKVVVFEGTAAAMNRFNQKNLSLS